MIEMLRTMSKKQWIAVILSASIWNAGIVFYNVGFSFRLGTIHPYYYNNTDTYAVTQNIRLSEKVISGVRISPNETQFQEHNKNSNIIKFTYSETAITRQADLIHQNAQKYVDIGSGPCTPRLPQCIIVGNFKCGTRELIDFMSMHPRIRILTKPYELEFFDEHYAYGLEWYRRHMPCSYSNQITVVKTPSYFQSQIAPGRIHSMNSTIRIVVLVREPVSRTISQFTFNPLGYSRYKYNLANAVLVKATGKVDKNSYFVKHSVYDEGMSRYLKYFNRSQIKVIETTDFIRDPFRVLYEMEEFLNLEHTIQPENIVFNTEKGHHCLRTNIQSKTAACYGDKRGRHGYDTRKLVNAPEIVLEKLKGFFKPHNENFFKLIGRVFDW